MPIRVYAVDEAQAPPRLWRIVEKLCELWPEEIDRATLAEIIGQSPTSSSYANYLGELRTLGLLDYPRGGYVRAEDILFLR